MLSMLRLRRRRPESRWRRELDSGAQNPGMGRGQHCWRGAGLGYWLDWEENVEKMEKRIDKRINPSVMQKITTRVLDQAGEKLWGTIMREVRKDLILPKLNLLKGTKVHCQRITDESGDYIALVVGPRDFTFNAKTGARESSGMVMVKTAGA
jgi:hypothetical protein